MPGTPQRSDWRRIPTRRAAAAALAALVAAATVALGVAATPAAYGRDPDTGTPAAHGRDPDTGTPAAYGRDPDTGTPAAYGRDPDTGTPAAYGRDPDTGAPAAYGRDSDTGAPAAYGRDPDTGDRFRWPGTGQVRPDRPWPFGRCGQLFNRPLIDEVAAAHPGARFTAAVHDHRTGCWHHLNAGLELTTASVIKAQVLAGVLLAAQDAGRPLAASEAADVELMMHYSHNTPPTSRLYMRIGGATGMEELDRRFGIAGTSHTPRYGASVSTAIDRTRLAEQLLVGGGPLGDESVRAAWDWMSGVSAAQSWGVTAGLPAGYEAALKNGFYPMSGAGWRVGTTGAVRDPGGGTYAMTVMTDNNPSESAGIALVERIAGRINSALAGGPPAVRAADLAECVEPPRGSSWSSVAATLGGVDAVRLRHLNGGEPRPLTGQRVCWA